MFYWNILTRYSYYDKPDGEALMEKLMASMALPIGYSFTRQLFVAYCHPPFRGNTWAPYGQAIKMAIPLCGLSFFFTVSTHIAARVRDKNDPFNHGIGAVATLPLMRYLYGLRTTMHVGLFAVVFAIGIKYFVIEEENEPNIFEAYMTTPNTTTPLNADNWIFKKPSNVPFIKSE